MQASQDVPKEKKMEVNGRQLSHLYSLCFCMSQFFMVARQCRHSLYAYGQDIELGVKSSFSLMSILAEAFPCLSGIVSAGIISPIKTCILGCEYAAGRYVCKAIIKVYFWQNQKTVCCCFEYLLSSYVISYYCFTFLWTWRVDVLSKRFGRLHGAGVFGEVLNIIYCL